ncbi:hypothetical protein JOF29_000633 [Kribbella aluminosa]|uniref:Uncharacterized protein n=1 Tax=Kribbella aluminosa TaxID=416017 RepID=A0ABS4UD41_9ACTN|nr:hypothetical protein [Kribbella aluminosa]MBP2349550.1 hypothetical protein [Kribbella aluminosa]
MTRTRLPLRGDAVRRHQAASRTALGVGGRLLQRVQRLEDVLQVLVAVRPPFPGVRRTSMSASGPASGITSPHSSRGPGMR